MSSYYYIELDGRPTGQYWKSEKEAKAHANKIGGKVCNLFYISNSQPRLKYDANAGEGKVTFPTNWKYNDIVYRIDVLGDWIVELKAEYERCIKEHTADFSDPRMAELVAATLGWPDNNDEESSKP
jgi:hypothetical protein